MSDSMMKELTKINMRNIIVLVILGVWSVAFLYGVLNTKDVTHTQADALTKLDTVMLMIIGYYLHQKSPQDHEKMY